MQAKSYNGISPLADPLTYEVIVQILDRTIRRTKLIVDWLTVFKVLKHFILRMSILFVIFIIIHCSRSVSLISTFR